VAIDVALMAAFALQHSVLARPAFKNVWTQIVPKSVERSTYVLLSCLVTGLLMWQWRSLPSYVWNVESALPRVALWVLFGIGWLAVPLVSLLINHFDLFGTRQVWLRFIGRDYQSLPFKTPSAYRIVRHPLYIGWMTAFWATPTMSVGHLLFAGVLSVYMILAAMVEERDLIAHFGHLYANYRQRVPMFIPRFSRRRESPTITDDHAIPLETAS
jgi:protein-S-isoprenylcysteine O-methyltransferase Ste14